MERVGRCLDDLTNAHFCPRRQQKSSRHNIESILHIETLKLGSKGSGDSVLVLMHVTYLAHLLCTYIQLTSTFLHALSPPDYWSGLGSAPPATAHVQNMLHSFDEAKKRKT